MSENIIADELVRLDVDAGATRESVIRYLADTLEGAGRVDDVASVIAAALAREEQSATGLPGGIAIPHCRADGVRAPSVGFARLDPKVDFGAADGPADLVFLIAAPTGGGSDHLKLLSALARSLVRPDFVAALRDASSATEVVELINGAITPKPAPAESKPAAAPVTAPAAAEAAKSAPAAASAAPSESAPAAAEQSDRPRLVAVTACPTGIAHTYMAADSLKYAAERAGVDLTVETQGSSASTPVPAEVIAAADAVIFATDVGVKSRSRFGGKPVIASGVKRAINEPDAMIADAVAASRDPKAPRVEGDAESGAEHSGSGQVGWGTRIRQILLTGVSYVIPFVAAGGLLIALGFLLGGYQIGLAPAGSPEGTEPIGRTIALANSLTNLPSGGLTQYLGAVFFTLGGLAFSFLVPALAGYIAFAIADRPGLAPGFTAGAVAVFVGAGFIGGLVGGLFAGVVALWVSRIPLPQWARGLMPVVIIPLLATLVTGGLMFLFLGRPLAWLTTELTSWLNGLSGSSQIILGVILGLMMCFDLGGPVNKAAYAFAVTGLATAGPTELRIMAAVMCAGMVPPLAMALATAVRPKLFTEPERENGKAAWLLGASFITEGAIPFAASDPLRVIPASMVGGAVSGGLVMAFDVTLRAPHGGIFVFFAMGNVFGFLIALAVGTVITAALTLVLKQIRRPSAASAPTEEGASADPVPA